MENTNTTTKQEYKYFVGIDFGTTESSCCYAIRGEKDRNNDKQIAVHSVGYWSCQSIFDFKIPSAIAYPDPSKPDVYIGGNIARYPNAITSLPDKLDSPDGIKSCADFLKAFNAHVLARIEHKEKENGREHDDVTLANIQYCFTLQQAQYKGNLLEALKLAEIYSSEDHKDKILIVDTQLAMAKKIRKLQRIENNFIICEIDSKFTKITSMEIINENGRLSARESGDSITLDKLGDEQIDEQVKELVKKDMKKQQLDSRDDCDSIQELALQYFRKKMKYWIDFEDLEKQNFARVCLPGKKETISIDLPLKDLKERAYDPMIDEIIESVEKLYKSEFAVHVVLSGGGQSISDYMKQKLEEKLSKRLERDVQEKLDKELNELLEQVKETTINEKLDEAYDCLVQELRYYTKEATRRRMIDNQYYEALYKFTALKDNSKLQHALKKELDEKLNEFKRDDTLLARFTKGLRAKLHSKENVVLESNKEQNQNQLDNSYLEELIKAMKGSISDTLENILCNIFEEQAAEFRNNYSVKGSDAIFDQNLKEFDQKLKELGGLDVKEVQEKLKKYELDTILGQRLKYHCEILGEKELTDGNQIEDECENPYEQLTKKEESRKRWERFYKIRLECVPRHEWEDELKKFECNFDKGKIELYDDFIEKNKMESEEELDLKSADLKEDFNEQLSLLKERFDNELQTLKHKIGIMINESERQRVLNERFAENNIVRIIGDISAAEAAVGILTAEL
ncbi:hypothetical protein BD408DRAFT_480732 [Parasitella parasitica]|nr:hypothetical protein BD408DRAFT_480732 [Parasitella parasitica]